MSGVREDAGMTPPVDARTGRVASRRPDRAARMPPERETLSKRAAISASIIRSKVQPPPLRASTLERSRLLEWLDQRADERLVLLAADAGFGKTTLLADWARRAHAQCFWYRLDTSDQEWSTYLNYLVAAVRELHPDFGALTEAHLRQVAVMDPPMEVVLATFLSELDAVCQPSTVFIFDDFHLVDQSDDVRRIMGRLFEQAPRTARFVLAGRSRPELPVGRMAAQGRLAELTTDDLRFTRKEIEALFDSAYGQPQEAETYSVIESRTEGWAASLQLVSTSIATRAPGEVRSFIRDLSGAEGPIYDFLAEEVLARLPETVQRILLHAALLDRIDTTLVAAAMSVSTSPVAPDEIVEGIRHVEKLGLISRGSKDDRPRRIHPLLKGFLLRQLNESVATSDTKEIHRAVARAAEGLDWLTSARHYVAGGSPDDAARVLGAAAHIALGSGRWGASVELAEQLGSAHQPPAMLILRARSLTQAGRPSEALSLLESLRERALTDREVALARIASATAFHHCARTHDLWEEVSSLAESPGTPPPLRTVAAAWRVMLQANQGGPIEPVSRAMLSVASSQRALGLRYYTGVALHNAAGAELARGQYRRCDELASEAINELTDSSDATSIVPSSMIFVATARLEEGDLTVGLAAARGAAELSGAWSDVFADAAYLHAICGQLPEAHRLLASAERLDADRPQAQCSKRPIGFAKIAIHLAQGDVRSALQVLTDMATADPLDVDAMTRLATVKALIASVSGDPEAPVHADGAMQCASRQGAWRWESRIRLIQAVATRSEEDIRTWLTEATRSSGLAVLEVADAVGQCLDMLNPPPRELLKSISATPSRWLPVLRQSLMSSSPATAGAAASLLANFGTIEDTPALAEFEKRTRRASRDGLWRKLSRRVSPTVRVHDLGRCSLEIGQRTVLLSTVRRKPAALLLFLVTRSGQSATKDQAIESLWPEQSPESVVNSLHQTLYFLRRDINPWYEDGVTADYVPMESEIIYLEPDLVQIDSVAFLRQATAILGSPTIAESGQSVLGLYRGRFAPEFEYEPWAEDWRESLHTTYLDLARTTAQALIASERHREAASVLQRALSIDTQALDVEAFLIRSLHCLGARDAALAQYRHYAACYEREYATAPPLLADLTGSDGSTD